jgi:hypothetical protein
LLAIASSGFLIFGSILDAISNSISIITPVLTYTFTPIIILGSISAHYYLRKFPLKIPKPEEEMDTINGLNLKAVGVIIGVIILLWIPRFIGGVNQSQPPIREEIKTNKQLNYSTEKIREKSTFSKEYKPKIKGESSLIRVLAFFNRDDDEGFVTLKKIELYDNKSINPVQLIELVKEDYFYDSINFKDNEDKTIIIEDVNFDGFDDFRVLSDLGATNYSYDCFLYDTDGTYVRNELFSQLYNHSAVKLNNEKREIEVVRRCTLASESETFVYKV